MRPQLSPAFGWIACSGLQALRRVASLSVSQVLVLFPVSQPRAFASNRWDKPSPGRSGDGSLRDFLSEISFGSWGYVVNDWLPAALDGRSERPTGGCGIARLGKRAGEDLTFRPTVVTYCSPSERRAVRLRCALHLPWLAWAGSTLMVQDFWQQRALGISGQSWSRRRAAKFSCSLIGCAAAI